MYECKRIKKCYLKQTIYVEVAEDFHERVSEAIRLKAISKKKLEEIVD